MYGVLSYIKKLEKITIKFANLMNSLLLENIEDIKEGKPLREAYNEIITDIRDDFTSYYLPVLDKLSKSEEQLVKEKKRLFYFNTLIVAFASYLGFKYTMPINLILFLSSGVGFITNCILNYKLNELIYTKDDILKSLKIALSTINKYEDIMNDIIEENKERGLHSSIDNSKKDAYNYQYNQNKENNNANVSNNTNSKTRKRIKGDGDK